KFLRIEKLDVEPKEMEQIWLNGSDEDLRRFIAYSRRDAIIALELLTTLKLMEKYVEMSKASGSLLQDIVNGGQSGMIENLLMRRFRKYDRVVSSKPDSELADERFENASELKGGAVLVPEKGLVEDVIILDYKSLYPTLMMAYNLCYSTVLNKENISNSEEIIKAPFGNGKFVPATIKKGIVPEILEELLNQRIEIKKKMKKSSGSERDLLDAKQYAIKILLNSFYGYSGYQRARLYDLRIANAVTSFGRENILKTQNVINSMNIEEKELHVCYGDTDSVFISVKSNKKLSIEKAKEIGNTISKEVTKNLPKPMELLYETFARRGILVAKKRYAMWIFDEDKDGYTDKLKIRGIETVRRDWCNLTSSTLRTILDLILKEGKVDEAISLANEKVQKIKNFNISTDTEMLEDLMLSRRYTKGINSYKNKQPHIQLVERMKNRGDVTPSIGDRIQYIIIKGKSGGRKGKKDLFVNRAEDPNYIKKYGIPIDTEYYINKQLLPPLLRIFEVLGGNKEIQEKIELKEKNQKTLEDWK
ncbi:MAG: DNA-directed DNA polymerase, partial [Melioribacteraceae bacterium]|nr:DNA-directed DNA polymerase [Melioribacteraceae bacterium]